MIRVILLLSYILAFQAGNEVETVVDQSHLQATIVDEKSESPVFKNIVVSGEKGGYTVIGKTTVKKEKFFYTVEDGHQQYISETSVKVSSDNPKWTSFELVIAIPVEKLPENGTLILNLYEKDESGQILHNFPVVLETFKDKQS